MACGLFLFGILITTERRSLRKCRLKGAGTSEEVEVWKTSLLLLFTRPFLPSPSILCGHPYNEPGQACWKWLAWTSLSLSGGLVQGHIS